LQIGPGIVYMMFDFGWMLGGRCVTLFHNTPEQPLLQRTSFVLFASRRMPALFAKLFLQSEAMHVWNVDASFNRHLLALQFERDIAVWNNKRYVKSPILCREDATILKHRRWFAQFYCESSPRLLDDGSVTGGDGNLIKQRNPTIALDDW
jgi:cholesterol 7-dehydrogenase